MNAGEIINSVKEWVGVWPEAIPGRDFDSVMLSIVNNAVRTVSREYDWPFLLVRNEPIIITGGSNDAVINGRDINRVAMVFIVDGMTRVKLRGVHLEELVDSYEYTLTGKPKFFAINGAKSFVLAPAPDISTYDIRCNYYSIPDNLVNLTDQNEVTTNLANAVVFYAAMDASAFVRSADLVEFFSRKYSEELQNAIYKYSVLDQANERPFSVEPH